MPGSMTEKNRGASLRRGLFVLAAQTELFDQGLVALVVLALEVVEQAATAVDHLQQATTDVVLLRVQLEVAGELLDAGGQQGDLHFRGAGIGRAALVFFDDLAGVDRHRCFALVDARPAEAKSANGIADAPPGPPLAMEDCFPK